MGYSEVYRQNSVCMATKIPYFSCQSTYSGRWNLMREITHFYRSTPVDCLHTILLGSYKYFFSGKGFDNTKEMAAKIASFPKSGVSLALSPGIVYHHHAVFCRKGLQGPGRDCTFVLWSYLNEKEKRVWLNLSKVRYSIWI